MGIDEGSDMSPVLSKSKEDEQPKPENASSSRATDNDTEDPDRPLFRVDDIPGKGRGLIATRDIPEGTRILCEKPLFTAPCLSPMSAQEQYLIPIIRSFSKEEQRQFLSLYNNYPGKYPFTGILKTNALPCGSGSTMGGVYPTICLINHNCLPNAHNNWNPAAKHETIHAVRRTQEGEEITISYAESYTPYEGRRRHLKESFGFECGCALCTLPQQEIKISDARRAEMQRLDEQIGDGTRIMANPGDCLAKCHRLHKLLEEEYHDTAPSLFARLYYDAFQTAVLHSDRARAGVFAEKAYKKRMICEGQDSPETITKEKYMKDPTAHPMYGQSRLWKRSKSVVPKGLGSDEFEKWLWKL